MQKPPLQEWKSNTFDSEDLFQAAAISLIHTYFPVFIDKVWHTKNEQHIPKYVNESEREYKNRCAKIGMQNKAMGKLAGVPDISLRYNGVYFGLELKQEKGNLQNSQKKLHEIWNMDCPIIPVYVARNLFEVYNWCNWVLKCRFKVVREG